MAVTENGLGVRWFTCNYGFAVFDGGINGTYADEDDVVERFVCTNPCMIESQMMEKSLVSINQNSALIEVAVLHPTGRIVERDVRLKLDLTCGDCPFYSATSHFNIVNRLRNC
jgi:hypothetical protein